MPMRDYALRRELTNLIPAGVAGVAGSKGWVVKKNAVLRVSAKLTGSLSQMCWLDDSLTAGII